MSDDNQPPVDQARYIKFHWNDPRGIPPRGTMTSSRRGLFRVWSSGKFKGSEFQEHLPREKVSRRLTPLGCCAFCGAKSTPEIPVKLTDEHIIPEFLGAGLELPAASCDACQTVTSKFESTIARETFDPVRKNMGLKTKKGAMKKSNFPVDIGGAETKLQVVSIEDHPTILTLPGMFPASSYSNRPHNTNGLFNVLMYNLNVDPEALDRQAITSFATSRIDTVRFCQMIAKVAHVYAVSVLGYGGFQHLVSDFVRTDVPKGMPFTSHFNNVGRIWGGEELKSKSLHELELGQIDSDGQSYVAVRVRLFASMGMPSYYVTVGLLP